MAHSSRHQVEEALARIADPAGEGDRSCLSVYAEAARAAADAADERADSGQPLGPLDGRVITIKDLFDVAGEVTRAGSRALASVGAPAAVDAEAVARLRAAGAVIVAKTNMTELAFSGVGTNPHFGTPGNPADRTRIPGGSTSGGAVACADGIGDVAIGTDTGGSLRIPAALCGLVGWKPTARRVSKQGVHPLSPTFDSVGPIARTLADCWLADAVLSGDARGPLAARTLGQLRIGVVQGLVLEKLDAIVATSFDWALEQLAAASCADVSPDALSVLIAVAQRGGIVPSEAFAMHRELLDTAGTEIDPFVHSRLLGGQAVPEADYRANLSERALGIARMDAVFEDFDVLVLPTTPIVAPRLDEVATAEGFGSRNALLLRNTSLANFFDLCAVSLPIRCGQALPCGLMLLGRSGGDRALFECAAAIERALIQ